jgi:hypothetical protein
VGCFRSAFSSYKAYIFNEPKESSLLKKLEQCINWRCKAEDWKKGYRKISINFLFCIACLSDFSCDTNNRAIYYDPHNCAIAGSYITICGKALPEANLKMQITFYLFYYPFCKLDYTNAN